MTIQAHDTKAPKTNTRLTAALLKRKKTDEIFWYRYYYYYYTVDHKKRATFIFTITLANVDRFQ